MRKERREQPRTEQTNQETTEKVEKEARIPSNVVYVRGDKPYGFYIFLVKQILKNNDFSYVELHGAGERSIYNAVRVAEALTKYGYVEQTRMKTKTLERG